MAKTPWRSWAYSRIPPISAPVFTRLPPCVSASSPLSIRTQSFYVGPTLNAGWSHLDILNLITSAKTLILSKIAFTGTRTDLPTHRYIEEGARNLLSDGGVDPKV